MKYNVHLYVSARVRIDDIEANSQEEAVKIAEERFDPADFFHGDDSREAAQWDEGPTLGALVDEVGDEEYLNTRHHPLGERSIDISADSWEQTGGEEDPKSRLLTHININGVDMHVEAFEVTGDGDQVAANIMFADDIATLQDMMDTAFTTATINGRQYVLIATPYGR